MPEYTFATLSSLDFEYLVRDLLQKHFDCHLESFKTGKDGGIDLRLATVRQKHWIIQCKRFVETTYNNLKREIKKEVPKIKKLNPGRFILCTSLPLLPQHKNELHEILKPYCKSTADIFGNEDLNNMLGQYPEIERQHFKLWLCSEAVLLSVLKSEVFKRTAITVEDIKQRISMFVPTDAVQRARDCLREKGYCLIVGIPGIGKTTTADMILSLHVDEGWTPVFITNAAQAIEVLRSPEQQIVYYDDFLGQTSLDEKLEKNEEDDITKLVKHCARRPMQKRFLLTTREYLLERANHVYEKLKRSKLEFSQCTITLQDYTKKIRAHILINHLFFLGVPRKVCRHLAESGTARKIVDHSNYNPRVIEEMCEKYHLENFTPSRFAREFIEYLNNPNSIWSSAYENQLSSDAKELLITFSSFGGNSNLNSLEIAYKSFSDAGKDPLNYSTRFKNALKELDGSFLTSRQRSYSEGILLHYHNPSVKDFTDSITSQTDIAREIVLRAVFHSQVTFRNVWKAVSVDELVKVVSKTIRSGSVTTGSQISIAENICYWIKHCQSNSQLGPLTDMLSELGEEYLLSYTSHGDSCGALVELFQFVTKHRSVAFQYDAEKMYSMIESEVSEAEDYLELRTFVDYLPESERGSLYNDIEEKFLTFASGHLSQIVDESNSSSEVSEAIDSILTVLPEFGLDENEIDELANAYEAQEQLNQREDMEADMRQEEYSEMRAFERASEAEIDNIIDSLRD